MNRDTSSEARGLGARGYLVIAMYASRVFDDILDAERDRIRCLQRRRQRDGMAPEGFKTYESSWKSARDCVLVSVLMVRLDDMLIVGWRKRRRAALLGAQTRSRLADGKKAWRGRFRSNARYSTFWAVATVSLLRLIGSLDQH
jgi:hypothetical protein